MGVGDNTGVFLEALAGGFETSPECDHKVSR